MDYLEALKEIDTLKLGLILLAIIVLAFIFRKLIQTYLAKKFDLNDLIEFGKRSVEEQRNLNKMETARVEELKKQGQRSRRVARKVDFDTLAQNYKNENK